MLVFEPVFVELLIAVVVEVAVAVVDIEDMHNIVEFVLEYIVGNSVPSFPIIRLDNKIKSFLLSSFCYNTNFVLYSLFLFIIYLVFYLFALRGKQFNRGWHSEPPGQRDSILRWHRCWSGRHLEDWASWASRCWHGHQTDAG